jgi:hypothetical protein
VEFLRAKGRSREFQRGVAVQFFLAEMMGCLASGYYGINPSPRARATAWVRLATPSLLKTWVRCFLTVSTVTKS